MTSEIDSIEVEHKKKLLVQHRQNLNFLEHQAAQYGLDIPLAVHNALTAEREAVAILERDLGTLSQARPNWQALVIDADHHWREIIVNSINQLGGAAIECDAFSLEALEDFIGNCTVAIMGISPHNQAELLATQWMNKVVTFSHRIPIILLAGWNDRDTAITLRHALRSNGHNITVTTIFKETFDLYWFSRIIHQLLIR